MSKRYDELVKRLWECAFGECFNCSQYTETTNPSVCQKELMKQAADAIEELSRSHDADAKEIEWLKKVRAGFAEAAEGGDMNHDYCHCADYIKSKCPKSCFRAQLTEDLEHRPDLIGIPMTYANLKGTDECPIGSDDSENVVHGERSGGHLHPGGGSDPGDIRMLRGQQPRGSLAGKREEKQ